MLIWVMMFAIMLIVIGVILVCCFVDSKDLFGISIVGIIIIVISILIFVISGLNCIHTDTIKIIVTEKYDNIGGDYDYIIDDDLDHSYYAKSNIADKLIINNTYNVNVKYYAGSDFGTITGIIGDKSTGKCNKCK